MCDRPSALFHRRHREIKAANLDSHSDTRRALKIDDKDKNWIEIEWAEGRPSPSVRDDDAKAIADEITARHPTRDEFYAYCRRQAATVGWHYIVDQADADRLADSTEVDRLLVYGPARLDALTEVGGDVLVDGSAKLDAPKLMKVKAAKS